MLEVSTKIIADPISDDLVIPSAEQLAHTNDKMRKVFNEFEMMIIRGEYPVEIYGRPHIQSLLILGAPMVAPSFMNHWWRA